MSDPNSTRQGRILVTGGTGLIGSTLCNALIDRGDSVVGLSRDPDRAAKSLPRVEWHGWEGERERPPREAFEGVEAVINLAGEPINQRWNDEVRDRIARSRIKATKNLVAKIAALEERPKTLISGSAIGYYGDRGDELLYEDAEPGDDFLAGVVVGWEGAAKSAEEHGLRVAMIRSGHVLDPRGGLLKELLLPFKMGVGGPIAGGKQYMSWIHRHDEIGILLWALDNETATGPINATAPNPVTNKDFSRALGKELGRPSVLPLPGFAIDIVKGGGVGHAAREGQRVFPKKATDNGYEFKQPELAGALANLLG
ncbi:MAG: TIGR01777 family oxidoreductase [Solirubrobacterales bacterium]|nr:TIGR01777 family oxidoreductase [Solirubrobacterales bacterium]